MNDSTHSTTHDSPTPSAPTANPRLYALALGALGVVYGDIGTSPIYALRECFVGHGRMSLSEANVLGILSLILWSLLIVISLKYLVYIMRADNRGEGGILALLTLVAPTLPASSARRTLLVTLGLFGSALLYGDGMITPAISVLSAVEGLNVATPFFEPFVIPIAVVILVTLFAIQRYGTDRVGSIFGPVTFVWFMVLAIIGARSVALTPGVLRAANPWHAATFLYANGLAGVLVLGSVFLVVTGGEALYADMGHFGARPIRIVWFRLVLPALVINYFGQGALLLRTPDTVSNPFYHLAPRWALYPLVLLATAATIIASQAVISGAFSLTRQALHLGYTPRLEVRHSSPHEIGQVYVPTVNWVLMIAAVGLVLTFRSSSHLAGAYGVAVTTTMVITTLLAYACSRRLWGWSLGTALTVTSLLLVVDLAFLFANLTKIPQGGWFPLVVAVVVYTLMTTWQRGRALLSERLLADQLATESFLESLDRHPLTRVPGVAVFLNATPTGTPRTLLHNIKHNRVVHETVLLLTFATRELPRVNPPERLEIHELRHRFLRVIAHYGYMERPNLQEVIDLTGEQGVDFGKSPPTIFLGRETLLVTRRPGLARWRKHLFALMSRNSQLATHHFGIPPGQVVELGLQVEL